MGDAPTTVACVFHERVPASDTTSHYRRIWLANPDGDGVLRTPHPPAVGDTIFLFDRGGTETGPRGQFRVVERGWDHASYGSTYWPVLMADPTQGPRLTVIVVADEGPFRDQESDAEGEDG
jgi:hypothetical protein